MKTLFLTMILLFAISVSYGQKAAKKDAKRAERQARMSSTNDAGKAARQGRKMAKKSMKVNSKAYGGD